MRAKDLFCLIPLICGLAACSGNSGGTSAKTPEEYLAAGWSSYSQKNYADALTNFTQAYQGKGSLTDAYNGAGWANARLGSLTAARDKFLQGLTHDTANLQILAGLAFVYNAVKDYPSSVTDANHVLQINPAWFFSRDVSITASDLELLLAEDYFAEGDFQNSYIMVQSLDPTFTVDVSTDSGRIALASEIERLRLLV